MRTLRIITCTAVTPVQPAAPTDDVRDWARTFVASPAETGQDARHRMIVADLLVQLEDEQ